MGVAPRPCAFSCFAPPDHRSRSRWGLVAGGVTASARSTFERSTAGIRDPDTADRNRLASLALCSCKPGADEPGEHWAREAVDVHDCFGGTERIAGKQSECSALFAAEARFSRPHGDCVRHRRQRGKSPRRLARGKSICVLGVLWGPVRTPVDYLKRSVGDCRVANTGQIISTGIARPPFLCRTRRKADRQQNLAVLCHCD